MVVSIRINPKDCQSVLDILDAVGFDATGHSFAQLTSLALSSLLEANRTAGTIPEPDAFQYLNRMGQYLGQSRSAKKLSVAKSIANLGSNIPALQLAQADEFQQPLIQSPGVSVSDDPVQQADRRLAAARLTELLAKKDKCEDGVVGFTWTDGDEEEFQTVYKEVYPAG